MPSKGDHQQRNISPERSVLTQEAPAATEIGEAFSGVYGLIPNAVNGRNVAEIYNFPIWHLNLFVKIIFQPPSHLQCKDLPNSSF